MKKGAGRSRAVIALVLTAVVMAAIGGTGSIAGSSGSEQNTVKPNPKPGPRPDPEPTPSPRPRPYPTDCLDDDLPELGGVPYACVAPELTAQQIKAIEEAQLKRQREWEGSQTGRLHCVLPPRYRPSAATR